jgi:MauM/NapG family ferredoxin protein
MSGGKKLSRRELFTFWRRENNDASDTLPHDPAPLAEEPQDGSRPWPRDRIPGPSYGRLLPLRPPGNMQEYILREACTRCGKCVEACPAHAIFPLDASWGTADGTPAIEPRTAPCVVCEGFRCTQVCPSGALQPLYNLAEIKMGEAAIERSRCVTWAGQTCRACIEVCPVQGAIYLDGEQHPVVDPYQCIGCGLCARACPTEPSAIAIVPRD